MIFETELPKLKKAIDIFNTRYHLVLKQISNLPLDNYFSYCDETNLQIYKKLTNLINHDFVIRILPYKSFNPWSSAIAYRENNIIFINTRKIDKLSIEAYSGNILHEICHIAGYTHPYRNTPTRKFSVPYALGYLMSNEMQLKDLIEHAKRSKKNITG